MVSSLCRHLSEGEPKPVGAPKSGHAQLDFVLDGGGNARAFSKGNERLQADPGSDAAPPRSVERLAKFDRCPTEGARLGMAKKRLLRNTHTHTHHGSVRRAHKVAAVAVVVVVVAVVHGRGLAAVCVRASECGSAATAAALGRARGLSVGRTASGWWPTSQPVAMCVCVSECERGPIAAALRVCARAERESSWPALRLPDDAGALLALFHTCVVGPKKARKLRPQRKGKRIHGN